MFNQALACSLPILNQLHDFLESEKALSTHLDFRESVVANFSAFEREAVSRGLALKKIDDVKYALAALTDECVMNSGWPGKLSWMQRPLQLQFFGEHVAGEGFFDRLSELRQTGMAEVDVLEIYALCLQFGFQGIYRFKDKTQWSALIAGLETQISVLRGKPDFSLSVSVENLIQKSTHEIPLWWVALVTFAIIFFMCLGYSGAEHVELNHAVKKLNLGLPYVR